MSGLEVAAAIATVAGACAGLVSLVVQLKRRRKNEAGIGTGNLAGSANDASRLELSLNQILTLLNDVPQSNLVATPGANEFAQDALWSVWGLLVLLESDLKRLDFGSNVSHFNQVADKSLALASNTVLQLGKPMSYSTAISPFGTSTALGTRVQTNVHDICPNALLYRDNQHEFEHLTTPIKVVDRLTWSCNRCQRRLTQIMFKLSPTADDNIWIDASGMMKSHCTKERGQVGWTCIWKRGSRECYLKFPTELALLKHMQQCHVKGYGSRQTSIDWPADLRTWTDKTCGYGATIKGQTMRSSNSSFVVG